MQKNEGVDKKIDFSHMLRLVLNDALSLEITFDIAVEMRQTDAIVTTSTNNTFQVCLM